MRKKGSQLAKRLPSQVTTYYADGKAAGASKLKASMVADVYHALRLKALDKGQEAPTEGGTLAPESFTWDDLRDFRPPRAAAAGEDHARRDLFFEQLE